MLPYPSFQRKAIFPSISPGSFTHEEEAHSGASTTVPAGHLSRFFSADAPRPDLFPLRWLVPMIPMIPMIASAFDSLVGTFVETSGGGFAPPYGSIILTHREAEFHNLPPCGSKIRDKPAGCAALAPPPIVPITPILAPGRPGKGLKQGRKPQKVKKIGGFSGK